MGMERTKVVMAEIEEQVAPHDGVRRASPVSSGSARGRSSGWEIEARDNKLQIVVHPIVIVSGPVAKVPDRETAGKGTKKAK